VAGASACCTEMVKGIDIYVFLTFPHSVPLWWEYGATAGCLWEVTRQPRGDSSQLSNSTNEMTNGLVEKQTHSLQI